LVVVRRAEFDLNQIAADFCALVFHIVSSFEDRLMRDLLRQSVLNLTSAIALTFVTVPLPSYAATGTVQLVVNKVGFIVGVGGGSGTLHFKGKTYRLVTGGVSAGTIGIAGANLVGTASNLNSATDIEGVYSAVSASVAVAGGAKGVTLQNSKGVILHLQGKQVGFEASLSLSGLTVSLQN
jgi:hypothetical protein